MILNRQPWLTKKWDINLPTVGMATNHKIDTPLEIHVSRVRIVGEDYPAVPFRNILHYNIEMLVILKQVAGADQPQAFTVSR
jgi:hypothetical protein